MGALDAWFDALKEKVAEVIEKEGMPAFDKVNAVVTEIQKQAVSAKQRLEALAVEATEKARIASKSVAVHAGRVVVDAVVEERDDEPEDDEDEADEE